MTQNRDFTRPPFKKVEKTKENSSQKRKKFFVPIKAVVYSMNSSSVMYVIYDRWSVGIFLLISHVI